MQNLQFAFETRRVCQAWRWAKKPWLLLASRDVQTRDHLTRSVCWQTGPQCRTIPPTTLIQMTNSATTTTTKIYAQVLIAVQAIIYFFLSRYAVATRADFFVRGVVRRRRAFRELKTSSAKSGRKCMVVLYDFFGRGFVACQRKDAHQNLGRWIRCV